MDPCAIPSAREVHHNTYHGNLLRWLLLHHRSYYKGYYPEIPAQYTSLPDGVVVCDKANVLVVVHTPPTTDSAQAKQNYIYITQGRDVLASLSHEAPYLRSVTPHRTAYFDNI